MKCLFSLALYCDILYKDSLNDKARRFRVLDRFFQALFLDATFLLSLDYKSLILAEILFALITSSNVLVEFKLTFGDATCWFLYIENG